MNTADFLETVLDLHDSQMLAELQRAAEVKTFRRGAMLIRQGQVPTQIFLLVQGIVRGFLLDARGKDITDCLVFRRGSVAMPDHDLTQPASINLEVLSDTCQVVCVGMEPVLQMLRDRTVLAEYAQRACIQSAEFHRSLKIAVYQYTAEQRYQWFLREFPGLIDQIPHRYIASLLNMSPVTLSRLRHTISASTSNENPIII